MPSLNPLSWWRAFLDRPNDSPGKSIGMALLVGGVCAVAVASSATLLKARREANVNEARAAAMLSTLRSLPGLDGLLEGVDAGLEARPVHLASGEVQTAYVLFAQDQLELVVLPVSGRGYQSLLEGYLVLQGDLETVAALTFYEQQETPGIGTRVTDPEWLSTFRGKRLFDSQGRVAIDVVQGGASGPHQVDGISGATRTSRGVENLLRFWVGSEGFGPLLQQLEEVQR
jgi:Na+-transporting NADH:ubiquinone oxidoreductase subunit C